MIARGRDAPRGGVYKPDRLTAARKLPPTDGLMNPSQPSSSNRVLSSINLQAHAIRFEFLNQSPARRMTFTNRFLRLDAFSSLLLGAKQRRLASLCGKQGSPSSTNPTESTCSTEFTRACPSKHGAESWPCWDYNQPLRPVTERGLHEYIKTTSPCAEFSSTIYSPLGT